ncbi:MAG: adenylyltransferase/cytidyltransferase family protein, partial [Bacteroidales bacterium]|nr:adenylyltransferase/cytidyltransferase family protein [Bacteroidales bacterium]
MPLSSPFFRRKVESFLRANGLRMEGLEVYYTIQDSSGNILAGAGLEADIVKCVAVSAEARSMGLVAPLISHIISEQGARNLKVFTKPENESVFGSLGFHTIARAPLAILMENGHGLENYCDYLRHSRAQLGISGVIVMNANPFTLGHKYLIDNALEQVDHLFIIPVKEDRSAFPYAERLAMLRAGVMPGSDSSVMPGPDRASAQPSAEENYFSGRCPKNQ